MIRHDFLRADVEADIKRIDANWFTKAEARTQSFIAAGHFHDDSPIWSTVKPVFMRLQNFKCIFCERQLEGPEYGNIEYDLEHFRPKSAVKRWPSGAQPYDFPTGAESANGYYWLAYEIENYAAACGPCNTPLKSSFFPISGTRRTNVGGLAVLSSERPFLCYPLGTAEEDPENLVTFIATTAVPTARTGPRYKRGKVIIDFFALNRRENLHKDRARMILLLGGALARLDQVGLDGATRDRLTRIVGAYVGPSWPHAACTRAFRTLWTTDRPRAERIYSLCEEYVATGDRSGFDGL